MPKLALWESWLGRTPGGACRWFRRISFCDAMTTDQADQEFFTALMCVRFPKRYH